MKLTSEQIKDVNNKEFIQLVSLILPEYVANKYVEIEGFEALKNSPHFVSENIKTSL